MQTQLLPLGNLVHVAQGRDVKMVLVDGEIVVKDARPLKVDRMPSDATLRRSPRALDAGERRLDTRRSQARDAARDHNPVPALHGSVPQRCLTASTSMALAREESSTASKAGVFLFR